MPVSETCGYRPNPELQPTEFCGLPKDRHRLLLHSFVPSNIVMVHLAGTDGPTPCARCGMLWFLKEDDILTCVACKQRYQTLKVGDLSA